MAKRSTLLSAIVLGTYLAQALDAQSGAPGGGRPPLNPGPSGRSTTPPPTNPRSTGQPGEGRRLDYLTGLVMLDDGSPPPDAVTIEVSCGGKVRPYGVTDSVGAFTVNLGRPEAYEMTDSDYSGRLNGGIAGNGSGNRGSGNSLVGCELIARLAGFRSDSIQLSEKRQLDNPNVGSIILHRLANVKGYTYSMTHDERAQTGAEGL